MPTNDSPPRKHVMLFLRRPALYNAGPVKTHVCLECASLWVSIELIQIIMLSIYN